VDFSSPARIFLGRPFDRKLLPTMAQANLAQTWLMTTDNADTAFGFGLVAHGRHRCVWAAFKLEFSSLLSVGQFSVNWTIRDTCNSSILMYDFGRGDAQHKRL